MGSDFKRILSRLASAILLTLSIANWAKAEFVVNITQSGNYVIGTGSGTLDTDALIATGSTYEGGLIWGTFPLGGSAIGLGAPEPPGFTLPDNAEEFAGTINGSSSTFGSGNIIEAYIGSGDPVGIAPGFDTLFVPIGYLSGSPLSADATWAGWTIASLGLTRGTYRYTWGSGVTADSFTINVGVANVPEPRTTWLLGVGGAGLVLRKLVLHGRKTEDAMRIVHTRS